MYDEYAPVTADNHPCAPQNQPKQPDLWAKMQALMRALQAELQAAQTEYAQAQGVAEGLKHRARSLENQIAGLAQALNWHQVRGTVDGTPF